MRPLKDSGILWIGEIPKDWSLRQANLVFHPVKNLNFGLKEDNLLSLSYGHIVRKSIDATFGLLPDSFEGYNIIEKDTIVLRLTDLQNDQKSLRVGISQEKGIITSAYLALKCMSSDCPRYMYYLFHCFDIVKGFYGMGGGIRQGLTWDGIKNLRFYIPTIKEQRRIANFLDAKCSEIDGLIQNAQVSIEEYKKLKQAVITDAVTKGIDVDRPMKKTESVWFAEIPSTWGFKRLKYLFHIKKRIAGETGHTVLAITQKGVVPKKMDYGNGGQFAEDYSNYQFVYPGDFAMNHMDLLTGWVDISRFAGVTSPDYRVFTLIDQAANHSAYYLYFMQMCYMDRIFYGMGAGVSGMGRWRLQADKFLNFFIPIPPYAEQQEIAAYLDEKCAAIDSLIASKEALVAELEAYKKSLIYEYVTGKKEVL